MFYISKDKSKIDPKAVERLLKQTYWADKRPSEQIEKSIENSVCYGVFHKETDELIGFARTVTDFATTYYLADVIVDENYRGNGIGKAIVNTVTTDEEMKDLFGILVTRDAHGLYQQYGFVKDGEKSMLKGK
ncbi:MAG: GNAT family N-acetyltransferase [Eubacteriaceae bacterium]|nr:GNAT family N-acetyltransferase [Eubacteriaceae bacterium]